MTHARIPIGYWVFDEPVTRVSQPDDIMSPGGAYSYGFNHEGFVTGGLNYLQAMLAKLKSRGIRALVDIHAMPGGSSQCQSYAGWQVQSPVFWTGTPPATNATRIAACSGAGPYSTTRGSARPWMAVGEDTVLALGAWVVALQNDSSVSDTVVGIEVVNEPALGTDGLQREVEQLLTDVVPKLQALLAAGNVMTNVTVSSSRHAPSFESHRAWDHRQMPRFCAVTRGVTSGHCCAALRPRVARRSTSSVPTTRAPVPGLRRKSARARSTCRASLSTSIRCVACEGDGYWE